MTRLESADKTLKIWQESPILGVGLGLTAYQKQYEIHFSDYTFLSALAEMGLLGGLAILGLFIGLFLTTLKLYKSAKQNNLLNDEQKILVGVVFYLVLFQIVLNFVTSNLLIQFVLWLTLGMIFSIISDIKQQLNERIFILRIVNNPLKESIKEGIGILQKRGSENQKGKSKTK